MSATIPAAVVPTGMTATAVARELIDRTRTHRIRSTMGITAVLGAGIFTATWLVVLMWTWLRALM
jgi:hypothetical protein